MKTTTMTTVIGYFDNRIRSKIKIDNTKARDREREIEREINTLLILSISNG